MLATTPWCAGGSDAPPPEDARAPVVSEGVLTGEVRPSGLDLSLLDPSVSPGDDFYSFANGTWLKTAALPPGSDQYGYWDIADERLQGDLLSLMQPGPGATADHLTGVVRALFASGLDSAAIDAAGISALSRELAAIEGVQDRGELSRVLARLQLIGVTPFFRIHRPVYWELDDTDYLYLRQTSLGLADDDILGKGTGDNVVQAYRVFMTLTLERLGEDPAAASSLAVGIIALERRLAKRAMSASELRDFKRNYNRLTPRKLQKLAPGLDWDLFFDALGVERPQKLVVGQPGYFREIGRIMKQPDWELLRAYLKWALLRECSPYLSAEFRDAYHAFRDDVRGAPGPARSRARTVVSIVNREAPDAVGSLYLREFLPESSRERALVIIANLKAAFRHRIENNPWLSDRVKGRALDKLAGLRIKLGGPAPGPSYHGVDPGQGVFVRNILEVRAYRMREHLRRIGQLVDPDEWTVHAQSTNAWYGPSRNTIVLPAGSINVLFRPDADDAYNYGAFGTRVAHEMTHGFDQQGRLHDPHGERRNWWTRRDAAEFDRRADDLVRFYGALTAPDGVPLDGKKTLGENIADGGGLCIAYDAYILSLTGADPPTLDGFSGRQRFFLAYAQIWREVFTAEGLRTRMAGWHAPPRFRTNGPLYHSSGFYEAFPEAASGRMAIPPDKRIVIW
jgi:predicted metalloendopeptidase